MFRIFLVFLQFPSSFFILMIPFAMALRGVDKKVWFLVFGFWFLVFGFWCLHHPQ